MGKNQFMDNSDSQGLQCLFHSQNLWVKSLGCFNGNSHWEEGGVGIHCLEAGILNVL